MAGRPVQSIVRDGHVRPLVGRARRPVTARLTRQIEIAEPRDRGRAPALCSRVRPLRARAGSHARPTTSSPTASAWSSSRRRRAAPCGRSPRPGGRRRRCDRRGGARGRDTAFGQLGSQLGTGRSARLQRIDELARRAAADRADRALPALRRSRQAATGRPPTPPTASSRRASPTRSSTHRARRSTSACERRITTSTSR